MTIDHPPALPWPFCGGKQVVTHQMPFETEETTLKWWQSPCLARSPQHDDYGFSSLNLQLEQHLMSGTTSSFEHYKISSLFEFIVIVFCSK